MSDDQLNLFGDVESPVEASPRKVTTSQSKKKTKTSRQKVAAPSKAAIKIDLPSAPHLPNKGVEETESQKEIHTISQLNRKIRGQLEGTFKSVWVKGEVSTLRKPVSGHLYFVLKDEKTQIKVVMFRHQAAKLRFRLEEGMEVLTCANVTVYEARGEYQLLCLSIEPVGQGALQLAFEQLKKKLAAEGLFEQRRQLPLLPRHIGVVTSSTGAALHDILKVLSRRYPNRKVSIFPAAVQGEKASGEIVQALDRVSTWNQQNPQDSVNVLIVGRGGGSLEDLWCFNTEEVARAIYRCPVPVISAVGHEIDFTISDYVADKRAPTPSAAAEIVVPVYEDLKHHVLQYQKHMGLSLKQYITQWRLYVSDLSQQIKDPSVVVIETRQRVLLLQQQLYRMTVEKYRYEKQRLYHALALLDSLSPLSSLNRGYSLIYQEKKLLRKMKDIHPDKSLTCRLSDGEFEAILKIKISLILCPLLGTDLLLRSQGEEMIMLRKFWFYFVLSFCVSLSAEDYYLDYAPSVPKINVKVFSLVDGMVLENFHGTGFVRAVDTTKKKNHSFYQSSCFESKHSISS